MSLLKPENEQLQKIYSEMGVNDESLKKGIIALQEWLFKQPHLPSNVDERRLRWTLFYSKGSVEEAKKLLDTFYTIRRDGCSEFFRDRDPLRPELQACIRAVSVAPLPKLTPEGYRISTFKLFDTNPTVVVAPVYLKLSLMSIEIAILEDICAGNILIVDLEGVSITHLSTLTLYIVRKYVYYIQNLYVSKLKEIHIINAPTFVEKLTALFKRFLKEKIKKRMYIHSDSKKLLEKFPPDVLPEDYGGNLQALQQINEKWAEKLVEYREWFQQEEQISVEERKQNMTSTKSATLPDNFGTQGNFRTLQVD